MEKIKIIKIRFNKNQKNKARRRSSRDIEKNLPLQSFPFRDRKKYTRKKKHKTDEE
jgi:hypothetical protein